MKLVQEAAFDLIQADARFLYALVNISQNAKNIDSNYISMSIPYIGIFADGAEQWCKKIRVDAPSFSPEEKEFYTHLRLGHKLYELNYLDFSAILLKNLRASDAYFYSIRSLLEKVKGYYNVGTDVVDGEFCGNTILCAIYTPIVILGHEESGPIIKNMSVIAGELAAAFGCANYPVYSYNDNLMVKHKDYHFYKNSPLRIKNDFGFILFSILCSINYAIIFIEKYFTDNIPQKFKFAYLQYFYLCDFINDLNKHNCTNLCLNRSLYNRHFRNCLAHYGLGQFMTDSEIFPNDTLKGLTIKAFGEDYFTTKERLYNYLSSLSEQIKELIL